MNNKIKSLTIACSVAFGLLSSTVVNAHPRWLLPSHFSVSKEGGDWLTFDVTASHGTFVFDKPAGSESAQVIMPDGRAERPNFVLRGKRRSMFDFYFVEQGTHKVQVNNEASYYSEYKAGRRDTIKRLKANKVERDLLLPAQSRDVHTTLRFTRAESYVTVGKPSQKALEMDGQYLELLPITHPSDIVEGEPVNLQFYFYGIAQQGVTVEVTRDGTLYRNHQQQLDLVSDKEGKISFTPEVAGRYLIKANFKGALLNNALADSADVNVHFTFEALLQ